MPTAPRLIFAALLATVTTAAVGAREPQTVFKGGVDLVNVTATVTDGDGRFIPGLRKEDFIVYDDGPAAGNRELQQ